MLRHTGVWQLELTSKQRWIIGGAIGTVVIVAAALLGRGGDNDISASGVVPGGPAGVPTQAGGAVVVHVAGAVRYPGVYRLEAGARVYDAVAAAGGFAAGADQDALNLAAFLEDGQQISIPLLGGSYQPPVGAASPVQVSSGSGVGGPYGVSAPAEQGSQYWQAQPSLAGPGDGSGDGGGSGSPPAAYAAGNNSPATSAWTVAGSGGPGQESQPSSVRPHTSRLPRGRASSGGVQFPVSLNRATQFELEALPRIGPALAARIIAYRNQHGGFRSVEELENVKGIGPKILSEIAPYVTL